LDGESISLIRRGCTTPGLLFALRNSLDAGGQVIQFCKLVHPEHSVPKVGVILFRSSAKSHPWEFRFTSVLGDYEDA
jgi:hypothetical protein